MAHDEQLPVVGITLGDINGVGPETVVQLLNQPAIYTRARIVVYGSTRVLSYFRKVANLDKLHYTGLTSWSDLHAKQANVVNCYSDEKPVIELGEETDAAGKCALEAIDAAIEDAKAGRIDVLITAPINKRTVARHVNGSFTGHTGYLAQQLEADDHEMIMTAEAVRVGLVTEHVPLAEVAGQLTEDLVHRKIGLLYDALQRDLGIHRPKVAVLGLNPHAGESGTLGTEEQDIIGPAVNRAYRADRYVYGPYAADGFFGTGAFRQFDGVLAMYHDQGLVPFKTLSFHRGVNVTTGLPIVRTSPDHGTGYDIAGKGTADASSLLQAFFTGLDIHRNRRQYDEDHADPVEHVENVKRYKRR